MFKTIASALAVAAALTVAAAPASAHSHRGFGVVALAAGVVGAVIGAEIASHSDDHAAYYRSDDDGPAAVPVREVVKLCPRGTHLGPYGHYCWAN